MKTSLASILSLVFLLGCVTPTADQKLATVYAVASEASYFGAALDLSAHPERKPLYAAAKGALDRMVNDEQWDVVEFQKAIRLLPVDALHGESGAILAQGIVTVYTVAMGYIDINNAPTWVKPLVTGTRDGLARALAAKSKGKPKGVPCKIPKR